MSHMVPFRYSGFYDVPRCVVLRYRNRLFLLLSEFREERDEYSETYSVYLLPDTVETYLERASWEFLDEVKMQHVGEIKVSEIRFDETKRKELDACVLNQFFK